MYELKYNDEIITIYEYSDAEALIKELAGVFYNDLTPVSRGGGRRNTIYYYNYPCAFDIETTTIRSGELGYTHPDGRPLAFPYLFQFNIYGRVIMVRHYSEAMDVFGWLSTYFSTGAKKRLIIYDHNLGYEYGFFKDLWQPDLKKCFALDEHHPVTIVLKNGLMLRDSYKMTNMSLDTLSKDWSRRYFKAPELMDYEQLRTPFTTLDTKTLLYSALDVLSLSEAIGYFLAARNEPIWTNCPTSTSFIRAALKKKIGIGVKKRTKEQKKYFRTLERCRITPDIYAALLRQARGGNTHANRRYTGQLLGDPEEGRGVVHFDITSSYPAQLVCYPEFPIAEWEPLDPDCPIDTIKLFEANGYCTLFDVVLIDPELRQGVTVPYIPVSKSETLKGSGRYNDNGRYIGGAEMLKLTIFGVEWPIIEEQYQFSDIVIISGYFARKSYIPDIVRRFVLELYAQKTELKGVDGKEIEYSLAKTYVNGVYGMSFTRIIRDLIEFTPEGIKPGKAKQPAAELERYQKSTSYFLPYAWGAMVATLGRVYLQKMIDAVGADFVYCDTDSIFALDPDKSRRAIKSLERDIKEYQRRCGLQLVYKDIKGKPHELGGIDEEPECAFKTFGAKKYITVENGQLHCTIAGVPKKQGAAIIGSSDNFRLGMVFKGSDTGKKCLWYIDNEDITLYDAGRPFNVYSNVAMLPVDYLLGISSDYRLCLQAEGINKLYSFKEAHTNQNEEYI